MVFASRLRALFRREKLAEDLNEELNFHLSCFHPLAARLKSCPFKATGVSLQVLRPEM